MTSNPSTSQTNTARRVSVFWNTIERMVFVLLNEDYKQKRFVFAQNIKQLINDDSINVNKFFSLTKLIYLNRHIKK